MVNLKVKNFLEKKIKESCYLEIKAIKPGNVHKYSAGHGMKPSDFYNSAKIISKCLTKNGPGFSKKILNCVVETKKKIKQNTNLGIILLLAPITEILLKHGLLNKKSLENKINNFIKKQGVRESKNFFKAIKVASPGGIGKSNKYDVNLLPKTTVYKAMSYASKRDLIAKQYISSFKDIFKIGIPTFKKFEKKWNNKEWSLTAVYLNFLNKIIDTHIQRKKGDKLAKKVKEDAKKYFKLVKKKKQCKNMDKIARKLLFFDKKLKVRGINPGTSADLTVASYFILQVTKKQQKKI